MTEPGEKSSRTISSIITPRALTNSHGTFARKPWDSIVRNSGISCDLIRQAAKIAMESERMICSWAMGITQHRNGVANVRTIVNFALFRGQIGRKGAGVCPVRGHSNVQGDRTVGIWEKMSPEYLAATPDTRYVSEAIQRCRLTVQISTKLKRGHLVTGEQALILPCLGRTERDIQKSGPQFESVEDTTGVVHQSHGSLPPASEHLRSEPAIIAGIAMATLNGSTTVDWQGLIGNYDRIREHIGHVVPGFTQYNSRVRQPGGFYLPNAPREGKFRTPSARAHFTVHQIPQHDLKDGELLLTTVRSHDQFNTTIYSENDRYRGVSNVLVPFRSVAEGSNQPVSKSIVITVEPAGLSKL